MTDRYDGKPFLRLLDPYVLDSIGKLDEANRKWLNDAEPPFRATYGEEGSWRQIVEARMQFPPNMQAAIQELWDKGKVRYLEHTGEEPDPVHFTYTFVDEKFPH